MEEPSFGWIVPDGKACSYALVASTTPASVNTSATI